MLNVPLCVDLKYNNPGRTMRDRVAVDLCLAAEIKELWKQGIRTTGCCCGHGDRSIAYIGVEDADIPRMEGLGYEHQSHPDPSRHDGFCPRIRR